MATKQEIVNGMTEVIAQAKRVSALLDAQGDWDAKRPAGWTPREMFCHVASVGGQLATTGGLLLDAPKEFDFTTSTSVTDLNRQTVEAMAGMTPAQLTQAVIENYGKAIEFVEGVPEEKLQAEKTFASMTMPASELFANIGVLHANHHLYEAALRVAF